MKTDVLARVKLVLGVEAEPVVRPVVPADGVPRPSRLPDSEQIKDLLDRTRAATAALAAPPQSQNENVLRRVEIMMTGTVSRLAVVRNALGDLQSRLFRQATPGNLELRVTAFLDGCRHTTPWSRSPIDAGNRTTRWHCYQGDTLFAEALAHSADESEPIDAIVMLGDRFDDNLSHAQGSADRLRRQGTRIYAFHIGNRSRSRRAYEQLASCTGGVFVQLSDQQAFARVMPVIAAYVLRPAEALQALPPPQDANTRTLVDRLKLLPPPDPTLLRLSGSKS